MSDIVGRLEATKHGLYWDVARDAISEISRLRKALSEAEHRVKNARREALEDAARYHEYLAKMLRGSRRGKAHLGYASHLRALIPSEPHDAAGRENPRRGDPSIFDDAEGRN